MSEIGRAAQCDSLRSQLVDVPNDEDSGLSEQLAVNPSRQFRRDWFQGQT